MHGLDGVDVAVDGTGGRLLIEPTDVEVRALRRGPDAGGAAADGFPGAVELPVTLEANVGSVREAEAAAAAGAMGIGLVRTELLFLGRAAPPGLDEQRALYRRIAACLPGRPVVFRTLDIGGDKPASYLPAEAEMNPALGVRGLRLGLSRPDLFETQLRALLEADPGSPLRLLLPMVATVDEVAAAREAIDAAAAASRRAGAEVATDVRLGIMVEIPSVAILADAFAPIVDFFSIGTNDLVQYTLAADRTNPALAELATPLQPAVLRLIRLVTDAALPYGRPVAVCGEAAADPLAAALFVGLGVDELSVAPGSLAGLRATLARLDAGCVSRGGRSRARGHECGGRPGDRSRSRRAIAVRQRGRRPPRVGRASRACRDPPTRPRGAPPGRRGPAPGRASAASSVPARRGPRRGSRAGPAVRRPCADGTRSQGRGRSATGITNRSAVCVSENEATLLSTRPHACAAASSSA